MKALEMIFACLSYIAFLAFVLLFCCRFGMWWAFLWMWFFPTMRYKSDEESGQHEQLD